MKCKLCGKDFPDDTRRPFHAHCIREHPAEYAGKTIEDMTDDPCPPRAHDVRKRDGRKPKKKIMLPKQPPGFRLLRPGDQAEAQALELGYTYIDEAEELYTEREAAENGWI